MNFFKKKLTDVEILENALKAGLFKDKVYCGFTQSGSSIDLFLRDDFFFLNSDTKFLSLLNSMPFCGYAYFGGMGSGKSIAMRTAFLFHLLANSKNAVYFFIDPYRRMDDFKDFLNLEKNVVLAQSSKNFDEIKLLIKSLFDEVVSRMNSSVPTKSLPKLILLIEDVDQLARAEVFKNDRDSLSMFNFLVTEGPQQGLCFMVTGQRFESIDFNYQLDKEFVHQIGFRLGSAYQSVIQIDQQKLRALKYSSDSRRVAIDSLDNDLIFPYVDDLAVKKMIAKYYKPLSLECLTINVTNLRNQLK